MTPRDWLSCDLAQVITAILMLAGGFLWGQVIGTFCGVIATFDPHGEGTPTTPPLIPSSLDQRHGPARCTTAGCFGWLISAPFPACSDPPSLSLPLYRRVLGPPPGAEFRRNMDDLNHFMHQKHLPPDMRRRLREYFHQTKHLQMSNAQQHLFRLMSPSLQARARRRAPPQPRERKTRHTRDARHRPNATRPYFCRAAVPSEVLQPDSSRACVRVRAAAAGRGGVDGQPSVARPHPLPLPLRHRVQSRARARAERKGLRAGRGAPHALPHALPPHALPCSSPTTPRLW